MRMFSALLLAVCMGTAGCATLDGATEDLKAAGRSIRSGWTEFKQNTGY